MPVFDGRFKEYLAQNRTLLGMFCGIPSPALIEMAGLQGFDFVIIDNEHGPAGFETTQLMILAAKAAGIVPLVRVSWASRTEILHTLDIGASGIQVPNVDTAELAQEAVAAAKYPPTGIRGTAFSTRAAGYGAYGGAAHLKNSNEQTVVVCHVETGTAVKNLDAILKVPGIDVMFVGPNDLSVNLGYEGNYNHPEMQRIIRECCDKIKAAGVCPGIIVTSPDDFKKYAAMGFRYLPNTVNGMINGAMRGFVSGCKG